MLRVRAISLTDSGHIFHYPYYDSMAMVTLLPYPIRHHIPYLPLKNPLWCQNQRPISISPRPLRGGRQNLFHLIRVRLWASPYFAGCALL